jgi:hypothetical protein
MVNFKTKLFLIVTGLMFLILSLGFIIPMIIPVNPIVTIFSSLYIGILIVLCSYAYWLKKSK